MYRIGKEEVDAVAHVINSKKIWRYMDGSEAKNFEEKLRNAMGTKHTLVLSSGTAALICGLVALGVRPGDEVIVPGYTFISTALAPMAIGAVPVIAEVDETLTLDPEDVIRKISSKTKAIIPVHMNGLPCDMNKLLSIAKDYGLYVLEDACQTVGGSYEGKRLGTIGDAGAFSFNFFKIISCGEGGALLTDNTKAYERARIYHDAGCAFFSPAQQEVVPYFAGVNYRMSEILSAIMSVQLERLDGILDDLRKRKRFLVENLCKPLGWDLSPVNDIQGDCGVKLGIMFDNKSETQHYVESINKIEPGMRAECPLYSDRHVYVNWEAVLKGRSLFNQENDDRYVNNYNVEDLCPKTLDYLGRTMYLSIDPDMDFLELEKMCHTIVRTIK